MQVKRRYICTERYVVDIEAGERLLTVTMAVMAR